MQKACGPRSLAQTVPGWHGQRPQRKILKMREATARERKSSCDSKSVVGKDGLYQSSQAYPPLPNAKANAPPTHKVGLRVLFFSNTQAIRAWFRSLQVRLTTTAINLGILSRLGPRGMWKLKRFIEPICSYMILAEELKWTYVINPWAQSEWLIRNRGAWHQAAPTWVPKPNVSAAPKQAAEPHNEPAQPEPQSERNEPTDEAEASAIATVSWCVFSRTH